MRRFIMSFGSTAGDDEEAGAGAGVGEGVEEREGTKIGVEGRDMVVILAGEEDEWRKQRRVVGEMGVVEGPLYTRGRPAVAGLAVMYSWRISGAWRSLWLTQESSECG